MRLFKGLKKFISVIATTAVIFNSLAPSMAVLAQEVTPSPTPAETPSPTPEATLSPTDSATPTAIPDAMPVETLAPTPEVTPSADFVTPTPSETPVVTQAPESNPTVQGPPASGEPTFTPTATPVTPVEHGILTETLIENVDLSGINLLNSNIDSGTITTDKPDYSPTSLVLITGTGFIANKTYTIEIVSTDQPPVNFTDQVKADSSGNISYAYQLDGTMRPNYTVYIKDGERIVATTTFTDPVSTDISQCQNGGIGDPLQPCSETAPFAADSGYGYEGNAAANGGNSHWLEGDFVPIRIVGTGYSAGAGNIQFSIDVTKGGKHAYDYIGDFDGTETTGVSTSTHANHNNPVGDIISGANPTIPDSTGTIPGASLNPFPAACGSNTFVGSQTAGLIKAWGTSSPLTVTYVSQNVGSSDCTTTIQVAWTATQASFGGKIVIAYAPHIASQHDWSTGNSAISISGDPYHSSLVSRTTGGETKVIGNQDAKLSASAVVVLPNTITIHKTTFPVGGTGFAFTTTGTGYTGFSLNDGQQNQQTVPAGSYTVTETDPSPTYANTALTCTASGTGSSATPTLGTRSVAITIGSAGGATIDCTYTNTLQQAHLFVIKHVIKDNGGTAVAGDFTLDSGGTNDTPDNFAGVESPGTDVTLDAGSYNVTESGPGGYTVSYSADCSGSIAAGQTKTCTVTNNDNAPSLTLNKILVKDNAGTASESDWTLTATGNQDVPVILSGPGAAGSTDVVSDSSFKVGTYTLSESTGPSGYSASSWSCVKNNRQAVLGSSITLALGDNATCTITNDDQPGTLTIVKDTIGGNGTFNYTVSGPTGSTPSITTINGTGHTLGMSVNAGTYSVTETPQDGWDPTSANCGRDLTGAPISPSSFTIALSQQVTCTFTNTKLGSLQGRKYSDTNMNGQLEQSEQPFLDGWTIRLYDGDWSEVASMATGDDFTPAGPVDQGQYRFSNLLPGTYNTCEVLQGGWQQTGPVLDNHPVDYNDNVVNSSTAVANQSGAQDEAGSCWQSIINGDNFTWLGFGNIQKGHIIVDKVTDPQGDPQAFTFDPSWSGSNFGLTDQGAPIDSGPLTPGVYSISELKQGGWDLTSATCSDLSSPDRISLQPGETVTCTFNNLKLIPGISITKSNNAGGGIGAGSTVTYTLTVENTGNINFDNVVVTDILPGGFTYVDGSTTGGATFVPPQVGPKLTWNTGPLAAGQKTTITYQVQTNGGLSDGDYKNFATCTATYDRQSTEPCNQTDSTVTIGHSVSYGGNLGQVLGISTELPATGNPTGILIFALSALGIGLFLNGYNSKKRKGVGKGL